MVNHNLSLTERALLNPMILDYFSPPKYEKIYVDSPKVSAFRPVLALHCLEVAYEQIGTKALINVNWRWEPVRIVGRVLYVSLVLCFVSPCGVLGYGTLAVYSSARSAFLACFGRMDVARSTWEKTKSYAQACLSDAISLGIAGCGLAVAAGGVLVILRECRRSPFLIEKLLVAGLYGSLALLMCAPMGLFSYQLAVKLLCLSAQESNEKRDLAFILRQNLGLVAQNGGPLTCSRQDLIETKLISRESNTSNIEFTGWANQQLKKLATRADADFFNGVLDVKIYLQGKGKEPFNFSYPFDLETVVSHLRGQLGAESPEEVESLVVKLESLKRRACILEELYRSIAQRKVTNKIPKTECYLPEELCRNSFNQGGKIALVVTDSMKKLTNQLRIVNMNVFAPSNLETETPYNRFKDSVLYSRWLVDAGGAPLSHKEMVGLPENCSKEDLGDVLTLLLRATHSDKNQGNVEANELNKLLIIIRTELKKDFEPKVQQSGSAAEKEEEDESAVDGSPAYQAFIRGIKYLHLGDMQMLPLEELRKKSFYDQFKAFAIYLKRAEERGGDCYSLAEIFDLPFENCSIEYYQEIIGNWKRELCPDNYPDKKDEATQLFIFFLLAKEYIDEVFALSARKDFQDLLQKMESEEVLGRAEEGDPVHLD